MLLKNAGSILAGPIMALVLYGCLWYLKTYEGIEIPKGSYQLLWVFGLGLPILSLLSGKGGNKKPE